jgi:hypothetical protein
MIKIAAGLACAATLLTACASTGGAGIGSAPHPSSTTHHVATAPVRSTTPTGVWYAKVRPAVSELEQSITYAQRVVRNQDHRGLTSACRAIRTNVASVRVAPKAPNAGVRHALAREIDAFDAAAVQCLSTDYRRAGHSVDVGHRWAEVGGRQLRVLLHLPAKSGAPL